MFNDSHILFFHSIFKYMGLYELSMEAVSQNLWWISTIPKKKKVESIQTVWRTQLSKRQQFFTGIHFLLNDSHMLFLTAFSSTMHHLSWTCTKWTIFKAVGNTQFDKTQVFTASSSQAQTFPFLICQVTHGRIGWHTPGGYYVSTASPGIEINRY